MYFISVLVFGREDPPPGGELSVNSALNPNSTSESAHYPRRGWHGRCLGKNDQMFIIWAQLLILLSSIEFMWAWAHVFTRRVFPCKRCTCVTLLPFVACVGALCAATWPSPLSWFPRTLCVRWFLSDQLQSVLSALDSMVSLSSFSPAMRLPQRISVWAEAITAHIQSHLSQGPNEGAFDRPRLMHIYFLRSTK